MDQPVVGELKSHMPAMLHGQKQTTKNDNKEMCKGKKLSLPKRLRKVIFTLVYLPAFCLLVFFLCDIFIHKTCFKICIK